MYKPSSYCKRGCPQVDPSLQRTNQAQASETESRLEREGEQAKPENYNFKPELDPSISGQNKMNNNRSIKLNPLLAKSIAFQECVINKKQHN